MRVGLVRQKVTWSPKPSGSQKAYIPEPQPVRHADSDRRASLPAVGGRQAQMWDQVLKHPERTPALGFYSQENPEVADWETKWAVEHGISFFIYCWYRDEPGRPGEDAVRQRHPRRAVQVAVRRQDEVHHHVGEPVARQGGRGRRDAT